MTVSVFISGSWSWSGVLLFVGPEKGKRNPGTLEPGWATSGRTGTRSHGQWDGQADVKLVSASVRPGDS